MGRDRGGEKNNEEIEDGGHPVRESKILLRIFGEEDRVKGEVDDATDGLKPTLMTAMLKGWKAQERTRKASHLKAPERAKGLLHPNYVAAIDRHGRA